MTHANSRYPLLMRLLHWARAALLLALVALGWTMTSLPDTMPAKFAWMYPIHKEFGVLAFVVGTVALVVRLRSALPPHPAGLSKWERALSGGVHYALLALAIIVPLMGYAMSSSFTQSDGIPFFGHELPEMLPKNDRAFAVFALAHKTLAYTLLALAALHILGVIKHRFFDRGRETDVLPRML
ncbi:cytochrome b [Sphingomonas sp. TDK1]|uniref:cytochrome b n=1 Tax=Sphingomonas sp. TDK1 TaxID=453247 RepID=UPI0007DA1196|nr:cytochrome b/b6 domain-containing protein [Sphingomonas sp. TDK1]OAN57637.1 cytochrome B [Sphingomonas sp. TDK1]